MAKEDDLASSYRERYPDPHALFTPGSGNPSDLIGQSIFALDTSTLLLPYGTGKTVLNDLEALYSSLVSDNRLFIPAHAVREFLVNRDERIKDIYKQLLDKSSKEMSKIKYPIFDGDVRYRELIEAQDRRNRAHSEIQNYASQLAQQVKDWMWDDPVSTMYRRVFSPSNIVEQEFDESEARSRLSKEMQFRIPPGHKNKGKTENYGGDSLIWQTLLHIGRDHKKPLFFVTGDKKSDWWIRSSETSLHPRLELIHEYREASGGQPLLLVTLGEILPLLKVPADTVQHVREAANELIRRISIFSVHTVGDTFDIYHLHSTNIELIFGLDEAVIGKTIDLALIPDNNDEFFDSHIILETKSITFDNNDALGNSTTRFIKITAPGLPSYQFNNGNPLESEWLLSASYNGVQLAAIKFQIRFRLLCVVARVLCSEIPVVSQGKSKITVEVTIDPGLDAPLPISLWETAAGSSIIIEKVEMGQTYSKDNKLISEATLTFSDTEQLYKDEMYNISEDWIVDVGDYFGYRKLHYWTITASLNFKING